MTKIGMRNAWFQVHKWIGLILAILIIPLCVTGAALVWDEALDHVVNPQRYAVGGGPALAPDATSRRRRRRRSARRRIATIKLPAEPGAPGDRLDRPGAEQDAGAGRRAPTSISIRRPAGARRREQPVGADHDDAPDPRHAC